MTRPNFRVVLLNVFLVALLLGLAAFAYFSGNPRSLHLEAAQELPVLGPLAARMRRAYLGSDPDGRARTVPTGDEGEPEVEYVTLGPNGETIPVDGPLDLTHLSGGGAPPRTPRSSRRAASTATARAQPQPSTPESSTEDEPFSLAGSIGSAERLRPLGSGTATTRREAIVTSHWSWFQPGNTVRAGASSDAPARGRLRALAWLPVVDTRDPWHQVILRGERVWLDASWKPPYNRRKARRGLLRQRHEPVQANDRFRMRAAQELMGVEDTRAMGAYRLLTDVTDDELLRFLNTAALAAEEAYFARYGRLPTGDPPRAVVLFADRADYEAFQTDESLKSKGFVGHAESGLLAFYAGGQSRRSLTATLVHEITHLLNDRALSRTLPPWLEEGLASDLGSVWLEDSTVTTGRRRVHMQAAESRLLHLGELLEAGQLPPVEALTRIDRTAFLNDPRRTRWVYAHGLAFVRYLLDGDDGRHADGFREFLGKIAAGLAPQPKLLWKLLEVTPDELDRDFRVWLTAEVETARSRLEGSYLVR